MAEIWYTHFCKRPGCGIEFVSLSSQKLYCQTCTVIQATENKKRQKEVAKSAKKDLLVKSKPVKRVLITEEEQSAINKAVALMNHVPPDPGRVLEGEEFKRLAKLYSSPGRQYGN